MPINESKKLPLRQLGKNGPMVSSLGLGCMGMSDFYGETNEKENLEVLNRAIDLGCTFWDTSDLYGIGENEKLLSKVLKQRRDEIFLCTKFGIIRSREHPDKILIREDKEYVKLACQESLGRLGIETIDLYCQHRVDTNTPIEETVEAMAELKKEGKIKYLGLSECSADTLRRAYKVHPISAVQIEFSPWEIFVEENGLLKACRELGVAIVAYSPLGRGFLTGAIKTIDDLDKSDFRTAALPRFTAENLKNNFKLVEKLQELAKRKGIEVSQLCLSWVLSQGNDFIPIPGTKRMKYLEQNIASADVKINPEEEKEIREIIKSISISGERYYESGMKTVNL